MNTNGANQRAWGEGRAGWPAPPERGRTAAAASRRFAAFTLIELVAVVALVGLGALLLLPALAHTQTGGKAWQCQNNLRQLTVGWHTWSEDNKDQLLACQMFSSGSRSHWMTGVLDFNGANLSNWDPTQDLARSPLWPYIGQKGALFKCPADLSSVVAGSQRKPRVRSVSMSQVFGAGEWLDGTGAGTSLSWRTYDKLSSIRGPANTFIFAEEHPDSINDGALAVTCTGNEPNDPPGSSKLVDFPASFHNGAGCFSFADGHTEIHHWVGARIQPKATYTGTMPLNVSAADSWVDAHWLAAHTTVRK